MSYIKLFILVLAAYISPVSADSYADKVCGAYTSNQDREACIQELNKTSPAKPAQKIMQHSVNETDTGASIQQVPEPNDSGINYLYVFGFLFFVYLVLKAEKRDPAERETVTKQAKTVKRKPAIASISFLYKDAVGDITERTVDVSSGRRGQSFKGYCHLRGALREFRFDRIIGGEVIDTQTGEIMTPSEWRKKLQQR